MKKYTLVFILAALALCLAACDYTEPTVPGSTPPPSTVPSVTATEPTAQPTEPVLTGWQTIEDKTFYFGETGKLVTGWLELADGRYFQTENGIVQDCWLALPEGRYYLSEAGTPLTGWQTVGNQDRYFHESGLLAAGLVALGEKACLFSDDGTLMDAGWQNFDGNTYFLLEDSSVHTGWLEVDADRYYFREDGRMAKGMVMVSETEARYFTSSGKEIILVNPWNYVPEDYDPDLVKYSSRYQVAKVMLAPLKQMLADCKLSGATAIVGSAYRTHEYQEGLFENKIQRVMKAEGCTREEATVIAATVVAIPGTSEHQLGLAVDLVDITYQLLNEEQEKTEAQKWLMEHCWEYGFILRYPNDKSDSTGIIYEPWHYRYVGIELSMELRDLGLSLEEYLEMLTEE